MLLNIGKSFGFEVQRATPFLCHFLKKLKYVFCVKPNEIYVDWCI